MRDTSVIFGKEFDSKLTGVSYGVFRKCDPGFSADFTVSRFGAPFAEDGCGNLFTQSPNGNVCFWDHESDDLTVIAKSWDEFVGGCVEPREVKLKPGQVKRVWADPNFKPKFN